MADGDAEDQIRVVVAALEGLAQRVIVGVTLEVHAECVESTPVDTGWARANWVPNVGSPGASSLEGKGDPSGAQAKAQAGLARVAGYTLDRGRVYITNNVPYIEALNAGHSKQAPAGFVEAAVDRGVRQAVRKFGL